MSTLAVDDVLSRLEQVRRNGSGWIARCPAHDDRNPSLSISEGDDGKVLVHCHAGCEYGDIVTALGIESADLNPTCDLFSDAEDDWTPRGPAIAKYTYVDEAGKVLYIVCRTVAKEFPCYVPDSAAPHGKRWRLDKTRRVLYRLPQILEAARAGDMIFVVEGEKDVHALERLGFVATTSPGGASKDGQRPKWRDEYAKSLVGARVVVLPDNDPPGHAHAEAVVASLRRRGITCAIVEVASHMQPGADASDAIAAGMTAEVLVALAGEALQKAPAEPTEAAQETLDAPTPGFFVDWVSFWSRDVNEADWVYEDVLARGRGHAIYAAHKMGKSLLMLFIAAQLATGNDPVVVIYLDYEMSEADLFDRLDGMGYGPDSDLSRLRYALLPALPPLDTASGTVKLMEFVDGVQRERPDHHMVVIIDTISRAVCGEENSADTFRDFYNHTGIELKRRGVTWVRLDHGGKDPTRGQRGSSGKGDDVDIVWKLTSTENGICLYRDLARMHWVPEKVVFALDEEPLSYRRLAEDWPTGTGETANILDRLEVPLDATARTAQKALRSIGEGRRTAVISAALRWRRERSMGVPE